MIRRYRHKPIEIEAMQFTGDNVNEFIEFTELEVLNIGENNKWIAFVDRRKDARLVEVMIGDYYFKHPHFGKGKIKVIDLKERFDLIE